MKKSPSRFNLLWFPRILAILFILFLLLFSFDVFEMPDSLLEKIGGFLMHSMPSIVMAVILALFWKKPLFAGVAFLIFAAAFTVFFGTIQQGLGIFIILSIPLFLIAAMFLVIHYRLSKQVRS